MKKVKKYLPIIVLFLILITTLTVTTKADERNSSVDEYSVGLSLKTCRFDDDIIHHFCFVKAGYVGIRNVKIKGFYSAYFSNFFFCIGNVKLDLIGFLSDPYKPRLVVKSLFGKTIYENDISLSITGFIGSVRQTGSVDGGYLKGFTRIIEINPL
jgi:hypothetical protein